MKGNVAPNENVANENVAPNKLKQKQLSVDVL